MKKGKIFVISAPSGCGKTTLQDKLLKSKLGLVHSVSVTTRPPRKGEKSGRDYIFVSAKEFSRMVKNDGFLERARTFGWLYGTPRSFVEKTLGKGKSALLTIDVKGALQVKKRYPGSVLIFIMPPSIKALRERLSNRKTDALREINKRLKAAKKEIAQSGRYDYIVINDNVKKAVARLKAIITAERRKA